MKPIVTLLTALALVSCTPVASVTEVKPERAGFQTKVTAPVDTLERSVAAAEVALRQLEKDPADVEAQADYNFAVSRIIGTLRDASLKPWKAPIPVGSRTLVWKRDPRPAWNPDKFDFIPADQLEIRGKYVDDREIKLGLGAPVVARRVADQAHELAAIPHFYFTATAIARFVGSRCEISIDQPLQHETVRVGNHTYPLAADFTAPLAMMLVEMNPKELGLPRLLRPAEFAETTRIARLEPHDPSKTVVLLVHGLNSSPATWFRMLNHLRQDKQIRDNDQFWLFSYPSGYPYSYSASILRRELDDAERKYPLNKKMVVIGHSMGGCVSHLLITDSKRQVWDQMFTVPPEKMEVSPDHKHILVESSIFSHRPEIGRVIFISTPHRGSELADDWIGGLAKRLVKLPATLVSLGFEEARYEKQEAGSQHLDRFPDSIDTLAPDNDFVKAVNSVPMRSDVPYHTIAGDRGRGDSPNSSDGVVPYWSSHQERAKSELIVPSHHGAHQTKEAIAEVERILEEHLDKSEP
ncbi:alpha/beta fold hydrolase [bacterium]|nr:alpha/beta fold hydrolase [bacterium]